MRAHKVIFITSMVLTFVGLVLQVQIPNLLNHAITNSIQHHTVPISYYVWWIVGLGVAGGIAGYISRLFLFETAYNFEYDLRNIIYEHLTKMSFAFYDRVQSGQLISRANSDIRSVQMYMTFAPLSWSSAPSPSSPSGSCCRSTSPWPLWPWPPCPSSSSSA